jgi:hypothetical protein
MKQKYHFCHLAALLTCLLIAGLAWAGAGDRGPKRIAEDPLSFQVNYLYRPGGQGSLKPLTEGAVLQAGDHYKIQFTPKEDSYVYIFQVDSSQAVYRLFPMESFQGVVVNNRNPVGAGVTYTLPAADKSFRLDDQRGQEAIYFMASRRPNQELEQQYEALSQARQQQNASLVNRLQGQLTRSLKRRGLAAIVSDPTQGTSTIRWNATETFTVLTQRLENLRVDRVSVITFEHR